MKHFDGYLYVTIAVCSYLATQFASDEAAKFMSPAIHFYVITFIGALGAAALGAKMYRSTTFAKTQVNGSDVEPPPLPTAAPPNTAPAPILPNTPLPNTPPKI